MRVFATARSCSLRSSFASFEMAFVRLLSPPARIGPHLSPVRSTPDCRPRTTSKTTTTSRARRAPSAQTGALFAVALCSRSVCLRLPFRQLCCPSVCLLPESGSCVFPWLLLRCVFGASSTLACTRSTAFAQAHEPQWLLASSLTRGFLGVVQPAAGHAPQDGQGAGELLPGR